MLLFTVAIFGQISQSAHLLKVEDLFPYPGIFALFSVCCICYPFADAMISPPYSLLWADMLLTLSAIPSGAHERMMECASGCGFVGIQESKSSEKMENEDYGRRKLFRMVDSLVCLGGFLKFISSSSKKAGKLASRQDEASEHAFVFWAGRGCQQAKYSVYPYG